MDDSTKVNTNQSIRHWRICGKERQMARNGVECAPNALDQLRGKVALPLLFLFAREVTL
jgi:hypothetical protein